MITHNRLLESVLAATDKVVQHANAGEWKAALETSATRRALLEKLAAQDPHAAEHGFVRALRDAAAESETALAIMSKSHVRATTATNEQPRELEPGRISIKV